ncbi:zinc-binding dehydrogenase [Micromonospora sp. NBC_01655]|uniref:zinc-binding dehydrogenase n=1 Tax=Micromonospora sp. NBC_01655 TaxID=2975983 RepID=UPI00224FFDEB|nr:zinc-binding dehydrogenase [Micromonospora sp. NBC_01655]MCX4472044.1 zinc-binding dehydrogenase [Micromonospora sp. NBC_01655]
MRVIEVTRFGGPEALTLIDAPDPTPGPGDAVVEVAFADVLWIDTAIRGGRAGAWFPTQPPYRPGAGVAGTVAAVGEGVDPGWVGRRVVGRTGPGGGYLDRALVPVDGLLAVPPVVSLRDAAALLHDGATAFAVLDLVGGVRTGERVLVTAAGGGVGAVLVQAARAAGARVVAAARGPVKRDALRRLGAEEVVDYSEPGWTDQVRAGLGGLDVLFDGAGGEYGRAAFDLILPGGRACAYGAPAGGFAAPDPASARERGVATTGIVELRAASAPARRRHLLAALDAAAAGRLAPLVGQTFPLDRAADAHRAIEERATVGKTLLTV